MHTSYSQHYGQSDRNICGHSILYSDYILNPARGLMSYVGSMSFWLARSIRRGSCIITSPWRSRAGGK